MSPFEDLPTVPKAPAPWRLRGRGYILVIRLPRDFLDSQSFAPEELKSSRRGRFAYVMFVDYRQSDIGPYHELLYIPGSFAFGDARRLSITKIYVSTWDSVVNGRDNWGIPKEHCDFHVKYGADGVDEVRLSLNGKVFAELDFHPRFFGIPFNGGLLPRKLRTLAQHFNGLQFTYVPAANGHLRLATLLRSRVDGRYFPDISQGRVIACFDVSDFEMLFPVAQIRPI